LREIKGRDSVIIINKADLPIKLDKIALEQSVGAKNVLTLSAKTKEGVTAL